MLPENIRHAIRLESPEYAFTASHVLIFSGEPEPVHAHRFVVRIEIEGTLDDTGCVVDFRQVDTILRRLLANWDGCVLLTENNTPERLRLSDDSPHPVEWKPVRLPILTTSAEHLAEYLAKQLLGALREAGIPVPNRLRLELEEAPGMYGVCIIPNPGG